MEIGAFTSHVGRDYKEKRKNKLIDRILDCSPRERRWNKSGQSHVKALFTISALLAVRWSSEKAQIRISSLPVYIDSEKSNRWEKIEMRSLRTNRKLQNNNLQNPSP